MGLAFISVCGNLFLLELEFLPLILIVIYVGAISVLFLFVVMMLDIKYVVKKENRIASILVGIFFGIFFGISIFLSFKNTIFFSFNTSVTDFNWFYSIDKLINLNSLG